MSKCSVFSGGGGRGWLLWPVRSLDQENALVLCPALPISLCPASFCTPRPNLPVTPRISWLPTFAFQSPMMKRTSFGGVTSRRSCNLHGAIQFQLLQHYWLGHRLELLWYWMICLGNEQRPFFCFCNCIQVLHFGLFFFTMMATPFILRDSCPQ